MKTNLLILSFLLFSIGTFAQQALIYSQNDLLKTSNIRKEIESAKQILLQNSSDAQTLLKIGFCYILLPEKNDSAFYFLQKAEIGFKNIKKKKKEYFRTGILLAQSYRLANEFDKARTQYLKVQKEAKDNPVIVKFIEQDLMLNENAKNLTKNPDYVYVKNLVSINSKYPDHSPMFYYDSVLIFTSKQKTKVGDKKIYNGNYSEDVFFSYYEAAKNDWHQTHVLVHKSKSKQNTSNCGISNDKKTIYVYQDGDIFEIKLEKGKWRKPKKTRLPVNSKALDKNICFSPDGKFAYLSSNRQGGKGGFDIYKLTKRGTKSWSNPVNIGDIINTTEDESSPFIDSKGTLYFSSKGHNGNGGYDIYRAFPDGKGGFLEPENMGWPINSEYDDIFFYRSNDLKHAVFTSRRLEGSMGKADIYMATFFDYLIADGNAIKRNKNGAGVYVQTFNLIDKGSFEIPQVANSGDYKMMLNRNTSYFSKAEAEGYFFETTTFNSPGEHIKTMRIDQMILDKIDQQNVYKQYHPDCNDKVISNNFGLFLNTLILFLQKHKEFLCDISVENNGIVSDYLTKNGIHESQLTFDVYKSGNCAITIYKKKEEVVVVEEFDNYKPDPIMKTKNEIKYTIQVGAFHRKLTINHWFFRTLRGKVTRRDDKDDLNRYIIGTYDNEDQAKQKLPSIIKMGFFDAFIREVTWYDQR